ncbi:MAG TPA: hypothetical protein VGA00_04130 [Acidiferrobacterales bacterium]|jgi:hypothetical protein
MAENSPFCRSVTIKTESRAGTIYVSSEDIEGLWLWGSDPDLLFRNIAPAIKTLYKHNYGIEVIVTEPKDKTAWLSRARRSAVEPQPRDDQTDIFEVCPVSETDPNSAHG